MTGPAVGGGGDIKEDHLVRALIIVAQRQFHRVPDVLQFAGLGFSELNAAGYLAGMDVQTRNDTFCDHTDIETAAVP